MGHAVIDQNRISSLEQQVAWLKSTVVSILVLSSKGVSTNDIRDICQNALDKQMQLEK